MERVFISVMYIFYQ